MPNAPAKVAPLPATYLSHRGTHRHTGVGAFSSRMRAVRALCLPVNKLAVLYRHDIERALSCAACRHAFSSPYGSCRTNRNTTRLIHAAAPPSPDNTTAHHRAPRTCHTPFQLRLYAFRRARALSVCRQHAPPPRAFNTCADDARRQHLTLPRIQQRTNKMTRARLKGNALPQCSLPNRNAL